MGENSARATAGHAPGAPGKSTFFLRFTAVFAVAALVLCLAVGLALTSYLASDIRGKTLSDLESEVSEVVAPRVAAQLPASGDGPPSADDLAALDGEIKDGVLSSRTVLVNVFDTEGRLVYSSSDSAPVAVSQDALEGALRGETASSVEKPSQPLREAGGGSLKEVVSIAVPLSAGDPPQVIGAAQVYRDFTPIAQHIEDVQKTVFISIAVALAVLYLALLVLVRRGSNTIRHQQAVLHRRTEELRTGYDSIVAVLCAALDLRDNVTHGHARRVSEAASILAWQMGLRKEQLRQVEKAAILHDIGKIGVADAVLSKPGPLDESEWDEMKRHPELGYKILRGIDFLQDAAEVVHAHHERYDGTGYPRGLKGDEIPLGARIFAVVDAYDAMTSHRPYRKALPHSRAVAEIARNAGTQFDPEVVRAFLDAEKRGLLSETPEGEEGHLTLEQALPSHRERTLSPAGE